MVRESLSQTNIPSLWCVWVSEAQKLYNSVTRSMKPFTRHVTWRIAMLEESCGSAGAVVVILGPLTGHTHPSSTPETLFRGTVSESQENIFHAVTSLYSWHRSGRLHGHRSLAPTRNKRTWYIWSSLLLSSGIRFWVHGNVFVFCWNPGHVTQSSKVTAFPDLTFCTTGINSDVSWRVAVSSCLLVSCCFRVVFIHTGSLVFIDHWTFSALCVLF